MTQSNLMDEFIDRMATQRHVLGLINSHIGKNERLFGLSSATIDRWALANGLTASSQIVESLKRISSQLFFLATRSQETVSAEYELRKNNISKELKVLGDKLREVDKNQS